jgi:RHS repeat-associated protein
LEAKTGAIEQPFGFSTERTDPKTGLVYYGYRFYHPDMERWLNRDPIGEEGGINLYGFVENNPVNWIDPWGLIYECDGNFYDDDGNLIGERGLEDLWTDLIPSPVVKIAVKLKKIYTLASEHIKGKRKSTYDKHTKPRPGRDSEKKKQDKNWKPNPNKRQE